jgi:hypothetical protein
MTWRTVDGVAGAVGGGGVVRCLERGGFAVAPGQQATRDEQASSHRHRLRCRQCGHCITEAEQRIVVDGAHAHRHRNPAGQVFDIGCFRMAPGCVHRGESSAEHTWFAGYRWNVAWCQRCGAHIGWRYTGEAREPFHGLILDRLSPEQ